MPVAAFQLTITVIRTVLLIPLRDNEGRRFPASAERELEAQLTRFSGFTRVPGVMGVWQSGGHTFRDRHRLYIVNLASWTQLGDWLRIVRWARERFRQEAMYVEVAGIPEVLGEG